MAPGFDEASAERDDEGVEAVDVGEVLAFSAALLADLPRGFALRCRALVAPGDHASVAPRGDTCDFVVVTSKARYAAARAEGTPTLTGGEWRALALATANDRAWWRELASWLKRKRSAGSWKLSKARALDGMPASNAKPNTWTVGEVLARLRVQLVAVECEGSMVLCEECREGVYDCECAEHAP